MVVVVILAVGVVVQNHPKQQFPQSSFSHRTDDSLLILDFLYQSPSPKP